MLFPPDAPSGAGPTGSPTAAASPAAGAPPTPAATSPAEPFSTPADDWQKKYGELENKYKPWEKYGDPNQVEEALAWARARAAEIQAGKLKLVDDKPAPVAAPAADDLPEHWEELSAREQRDWLRADARKAMQAERAAMQAELEAPLQQQLKIIGMQQQIYMQADRLSREYGVPFEDAMAEAMKISQADSATLLKMAFESKATPARTEKEIERRVQEALAKQKQEQENAELALITNRGAPRFATEAAKDPAEQRATSRMAVLRTIREEMNRGRGARSA